MITPKQARSKHSEWLNGLNTYTVKLSSAMAEELAIAAKETHIREEQFISEAVESVLAARRLERIR